MAQLWPQIQKLSLKSENMRAPWEIPVAAGILEMPCHLHDKERQQLISFEACSLTGHCLFGKWNLAFDFHHLVHCSLLGMEKLDAGALHNE
ncbi:Hypothetical predicted protein [Paramuricea clavata]|uniref:Uncharacterized protein n=1 Tax=Paramuricea clavata TaxID=317549 RepID=A0A6S7IN93_PARCT|nr:Hypothetical predicted protein [Paramuricea clavata]